MLDQKEIIDKLLEVVEAYHIDRKELSKEVISRSINKINIRNKLIKIIKENPEEFYVEEDEERAVREFLDGNSIN